MRVSQLAVRLVMTAIAHYSNRNLFSFKIGLLPPFGGTLPIELETTKRSVLRWCESIRLSMTARFDQLLRPLLTSLLCQLMAKEISPGKVISLLPTLAESTYMNFFCNVWTS